MPNREWGNCSNFTVYLLTLLRFAAKLWRMETVVSRVMMGMMMCNPKPLAALGPSSRG